MYNKEDLIEAAVEFLESVSRRSREQIKRKLGHRQERYGPYSSKGIGPEVMTDPFIGRWADAGDETVYNLAQNIHRRYKTKREGEDAKNAGFMWRGNLGHARGWLSKSNLKKGYKKATSFSE